MSSPIVIIDPNGTPRQIPAGTDAKPYLDAGGKMGIRMVDPQGTPRYVPFDQYGTYAQDKLNSMPNPGEQVQSNPNASWYQPTLDSAGRFLKGAGQAIASGVSGLAQTAAKPPSAAELLTGPAGEAINRFIIQPGIQQAQQGQQAYNQGNYSEAAGHTLAAVTPGVGPIAAGIGQTIGTQAGQGNYSGAAGTLAGNALLAAILGRAGKAIMPESPVQGQNYTPGQGEAFSGLQANAAGMGKNFIPQQHTAQALTPLRETAARMAQGTPEEQGTVQTATSGQGVNPLGAVQNMIQRSLQDLEDQHTPVLQAVRNQAVDPTPLVQGLQSKVSPTTAPSDVNGINELVDRAKNVQTVGDLNRFRSELNAESSPSYRQSSVAASRGAVSDQALNDLAGNVRGMYYDTLQNLTGQDMQGLKAKEANLLTVKEALENQTSPAATAEAKFNAPQTVRGRVGELGELISNPKKTISQTILRESPMERTNMLIRKSLADLPMNSPGMPQGVPIAPQGATASNPITQLLSGGGQKRLNP